jgi:chromosome segregation ATPase
LQDNQLSEKSSELAKLHSELRGAREEFSQKDKENSELVLKLEQIQGQTEKLEQTIAALEAELSQLKSTYQENVKQLDQVQNHLTDKTYTIKKLEERVTELEPLSEAVEQEKLRRIEVTFFKKYSVLLKFYAFTMIFNIL